VIEHGQVQARAREQIAQRAKNGHPNPYRVKYWQIGNELASPEYQAHIADFCRAMKKVDPTIQLLSSFPNPAILTSAGEQLDFVAPHHYTRDLAAMERDLLNIARMINDNAPPNRANKIKIAVTEWNVTAGDWGPKRATLWTLDNALACARYHNLMHRHADLVTIANRSNLANSFCSGMLLTPALTLGRLLGQRLAAG